MQITIGSGVAITVSVDYYEPASEGSRYEPPSGEYIEWSTDCERSQALIDLSKELYEALTEKVLQQYKSDTEGSAAEAADAALEHARYAHMEAM